MKNFKKLSFVLAFAVLLTSILSFNFNASALKVGDKLGDVLNSDIKTYINGEQIPCYNIQNKAVVLVADLKNYGFDVNYSSSTRTSVITRNYDKKFTPIENIENTTSGKVGTAAFDYLYSDIVATLGGKKIESFNVQGNLAIFFESLGEYGSFSWDSATRSSKLTLTSAVPDPTADDSDTVYIADTGKKYHSYDCRYVQKSRTAISKSDAIKQGYTACSVCKP